MLQNNPLHYSEVSFPGNLFEKLIFLESISIQTTFLESVSLEEFGNMLKMFPLTLQELNINIPGGDGIAGMIKKFTQLRKIGLYGPYDKALEIRNDTFKSLHDTPIEELRIKAPKLSKVEALAFQHFPKLKTLDMSETKGLTIADFYPALLGLKSTKLEKLVLSFFTRDSFKPELVTLNDTYQENFDLRYLKDLQMNHAEIFLLSDRGKHLSKLINLERLNMSYNFLILKHINAIFWDRLINLRQLDLSYQTYIIRTSSVAVALFLPPKFINLFLSNSGMVDGESPSTIVIQNPTSVRNFKFTGLSMRMLIEFVVRYPNPEVSFGADLSSNKLVSLRGSFDTSIQNGLNVHRLFVHDNKLGQQLEDEGERVFRKFGNLTKLDLTLNEIKQLQPSTFIHQYELQYLNLSKNSLIYVRFEISHMKNISYIDLSDNLISQFDQKLQNDIDCLKLHSPNFTINMLGNPIQCSCETRTFLWWMYHKRSMFSQFEEYTCIYNNEATSFGNMSLFLKTMDFHCSQNLIMKLAAGLLAFVIFMVALSVFLYRHKWDVKFFCLRFITNRKAYQELQETDTEYEYDAFVSYHKDDRAWVRNELYENIDMRDGEVDTIDQPRFRLCIHDRDFIPGEAIEENILKAIESSRKTIVVLSKNFLKSAWCEFELQIARKECVEKGRNLIIAVMLEPLSVDDKMSRSVERLIRKNTYIDWPEDPSKREQFWNKLIAALNL